MKHTLLLTILLILFIPNTFFAGEYQKCKIVYESGKTIDCEIIVERPNIFIAEDKAKCIINGQKTKIDLNEVSQIIFDSITYLKSSFTYGKNKTKTFFLTQVLDGTFNLYKRYYYDHNLGLTNTLYFTQGEFKDSELEQFYNPREDIRTYFKDICPVIHEKLQDDGYWIQSLRNLQNLFEDVNDACK